MKICTTLKQSKVYIKTVIPRPGLLKDLRWVFFIIIYFYFKLFQILSGKIPSFRVIDFEDIDKNVNGYDSIIMI